MSVLQPIQLFADEYLRGVVPDMTQRTLSLMCGQAENFFSVGIRTNPDITLSKLLEIQDALALEGDNKVAFWNTIVGLPSHRYVPLRPPPPLPRPEELRAKKSDTVLGRMFRAAPRSTWKTLLSAWYLRNKPNNPSYKLCADLAKNPNVYIPPDVLKTFLTDGRCPLSNIDQSIMWIIMGLPKLKPDHVHDRGSL